MESHRKGDLTEAILIAELTRRSIPVSLPFGDDERCDVVLETLTGALLRVQIKTGWLSDGKPQCAFQFPGSPARERIANQSSIALNSPVARRRLWPLLFAIFYSVNPCPGFERPDRQTALSIGSLGI